MLCLLMSAPYAQQFVQYQASGADGNRAVGDIECGKMSAGKQHTQPASVKVQKVDDIAIEQPIDYVADCAAQDAGQCE